MNPLRRLARAIDRWAGGGVDREVAAALGQVADSHITYSKLPARAHPPAPGTSPPAAAWATPPRGPVAADGMPLPDPPPGLDERIAYTIRVWRCDCVVMWDGRGVASAKHVCRGHADLRQWDEELSQ